MSCITLFEEKKKKVEGTGDFSQLGEYNIEYLFEKIKKIFSRVKPQIKVQSKEKKRWAKTPREGFMGRI